MTIEATTVKERQLLRRTAQLGLRVLPVGDTGAVRVVGLGVDVMAHRLRDLDMRDLAPFA